MLIHEAVEAILTLHRSHLDEAVQPPSDETLKKAAAGDKDALGDIYSRYYDELVKAARGRARGMSPDEVEDVVSDFFTHKVLGGNALQSFVGKGGKPHDLVRFLARSVQNAVINKTKSPEKKHVELTGGETSSKKDSSGHTAGVVRKAVHQTLDAPGIPAAEKQFLKSLLLSPEGGVSGGKGNIGKLAAQHAPVGHKDPANWGTKVKKRFLQRFCTNRAICDLVKDAAPSARQKAKAFCASVPGACIEVVEVAFAASALMETQLEAEVELSEDDADEMVLAWMRGTYQEV